MRSRMLYEFGDEYCRYLTEVPAFIPKFSGSGQKIFVAKQLGYRRKLWERLVIYYSGPSSFSS
jgi:hypothetical protein